MKTISVKRLKLNLSQDQAAEMLKVAKACRRGRNAGVENWLLRQRGLPLSEKQSAPPQPRMVKNKETGERELRQREDSSESTKIYHAIREATPELDAQLASALAQDVNSLLSAKVDWRRQDGAKQRRRRDEILDYEQRPPFSQALKVPVLGKRATLNYGPQTSLTVRFIRREFGDEMEIEILTKRLGTKDKRKLLEISQGARKFQDSQIVYRPEKNSWYLMLVISEDGADLMDPGIGVVLRPTVGEQGGRQDRPFVAGAIGDGRGWYLGDGRYLKAILSRIITAEKEIGYAYRNRTGAGHGRGKRDKAIAHKRRQRRHQLEEFRRRLIRDIVRQCERKCAGTLVYREPSLPLREQCWFALNGIDWDWTRFYTDLKNACARAGVAVSKKQLKWKEATESNKLHPV